MGRSSRGHLPAVIGALTGGLLSSSCCVLQLLLNYTSIGCAGFSVLTPYQRYFRFLTVGILGYLLSRQGINSRTLTTAAFSLMLMFSQDAVSTYNKRAMPPALEQLLARLNTTSSSSRSKGSSPPANSKYTLAVSGIRCEACASRVKGILLGLDGVHNCSVSLADGKVEVWTDGGSVQGQEIAAAVAKKGYETRILQHQCYDNRSKQQPCPDEPSPAAAAAGVAMSKAPLQSSSGDTGVTQEEL
jgi:copper chaperone CopZ